MSTQKMTQQMQQLGDNEIQLSNFHFVGDDHVIPFEAEGLDARGRAVQLGPVLDSILTRHDYPYEVSCLLAEVITLTVLLGTSLKFDGKFILQTRSDGPVDMLACDFQTPSQIRAYARFDAEKLQQAVANGEVAPEQLLGKGTLALTVDQGAHMQRYQGIVALDGSSLEEIAHNYFMQSEQIATQVRLASARLVSRDEKGESETQWRAGGMVVQYLPQSEQRQREQANTQRDHVDWEEVKALVATIGDDELTDPQVPVERLLYRLFHEKGVRIFDPIKLVDQCSCSREKVYQVLNGFSQEELEQSIEDDEITVKCEFCSTVYHFEPQEFNKS